MKKTTYKVTISSVNYLGEKYDTATIGSFASIGWARLFFETATKDRTGENTRYSLMRDDEVIEER